MTEYIWVVSPQSPIKDHLSLRFIMRVYEECIRMVHLLHRPMPDWVEHLRDTLTNRFVIFSFSLSFSFSFSFRAYFLELRYLKIRLSSIRVLWSFTPDWKNKIDEIDKIPLNHNFINMSDITSLTSQTINTYTQEPGYQ